MERVSHIAEIAGLKEEARRLGFSSVEERNEALSLIAHGLERDWESIKAANDEDVAEATDAGVAAALVKRLVYSETKQREAQNGIADVMALGDPIGRVRQKRELDEGLILTQVTVPIGVIGMIFEARPDALVQIVTLCLKSGNAIILKGGSEARRTNAALVASMRKSLEKSRLASGWIVLLESRSDVSEMLTMEDSIDLLIPRGSKEFVSYIMSHTAIPVLGHADGICHLYIDERADLSMALAVAYDAKTQYPAACNAVETILVHQQIAAAFIPALKQRFGQDVVIHGDERCAALIDCIPYQDGDYDTEYLDMAVNIRVVDSIDEAIAHIARHGSSHTDAIVTGDEAAKRTFLAQVDSADVFVNCSTRFADGYRFGLGAEVGISTQKIHARGPVGMEGLLSTKYLLEGSGQIVADYTGDGEHTFTHIELSTEEGRHA
ncbi:MAG TPA: glutamate-5-semialdehyde dehydrogenase [Sphaerochaeta sp.]|jgi:glutamate-5-semialdehyde dehydrogenase|nr:glutamate-5-semialdehyde dehydrogenase [Spirochaetales bacterium]HOE84057.1 glutamate-5-semialdehyde dehydrogenase [Sphaerochaeta sp.]